jgi:hypothetical protein
MEGNKKKCLKHRTNDQPIERIYKTLRDGKYEYTMCYDDNRYDTVTISRNCNDKLKHCDELSTEFEHQFSPTGRYCLLIYIVIPLLIMLIIFSSLTPKICCAILSSIASVLFVSTLIFFFASLRIKKCRLREANEELCCDVLTQKSIEDSLESQAKDTTLDSK